MSGSNLGPLDSPCLYFAKPGPDNTRPTLERAAERAAQLEIRSVVVASTTGRTGMMAAELFRGRNLVVVTHSMGFVRPDVQEMSAESRRALEKAGARVLTAQHALGGVGRAVRKKLGTYEVDEIMAFTLRILGQGSKVAVECAVMAADAGLVSTQEPCISIGGTDGGADTALVLRPANAQSFFDLRVMEFLAKPREW